MNMNDETINRSFPARPPEAPMNQANDSQELLRDMAALTQASRRTVNGSVTDVVGGWLAAQYAGTIHAELAGAAGPRRWEILRACVQDWTKLRRGDHVSARLQLARDQLDWKRVKNQGVPNRKS
jgi:hypothetical protein